MRLRGCMSGSARSGAQAPGWHVKRSLGVAGSKPAARTKVTSLRLATNSSVSRKPSLGIYMVTPSRTNTEGRCGSKPACRSLSPGFSEAKSTGTKTGFEPEIASSRPALRACTFGWSTSKKVTPSVASRSERVSYPAPRTTICLAPRRSAWSISASMIRVRQYMDSGMPGHSLIASCSSCEDSGSMSSPINAASARGHGPGNIRWAYGSTNSRCAGG